jgi:hypothetical protein
MNKEVDKQCMPSFVAPGKVPAQLETGLDAHLRRGLIAPGLGAANLRGHV